MFSHTTKGQAYNMELLSRFLSNRDSGVKGKQPKGLEARLIDYELLVGEDGKRTVGFGWFAGGEFDNLLKSWLDAKIRDQYLVA